MFFLHRLFFGFGADFAFFAILHRRHAAFFHFTHAHLTHAIFAAFAFSGFTALTAFSVLAALAFFTTRHFHTHAGWRSTLRIGAGSNKNQKYDRDYFLKHGSLIF